MISTGARTCKITLDTPSANVPDGMGGYTEGWLPLAPATAWARINPATSADMERAAAGTTLDTASHVIEMLYHRQITTHTRIQYRDPDKGLRTFQVSSVRCPDEARRELVIVATEIVS